MTTKTLEYYLSLPYTAIVIPDREAGGYVAQIKELLGCITQADTWQELEFMLNDAMRGWIELALDDGHEIPEPTENMKVSVT
ncbi:MAG: type II toxin-antitoxin system HicB family antitoxin [Aggregatilineales bacterium]